MEFFEVIVGGSERGRTIRRHNAHLAPLPSLSPFVDMPQKHIPNEILCCIFSHFPDESVPANHFSGFNSHFNCSLVSRAWRAVVLPKLWNDLSMDHLCLWDIPAKFELLACSLVESRANLAPGHVDRASLIKSVVIYAGTVGTDNDPLNVTSSILLILQLLSPSQLGKISVRFADCPACYVNPFTTLLPTLFPSLLHNLKEFSFDGLCESTSDNDIFLQHLPESLETLSLGSSTLDTTMFDLISNMSSNVPPRSHLVNFDRLSTLPHLTSLKLLHLRTIPPLLLEQGLRTWSHRLRRLTIEQCDHLCRESLIRALCAHCPNLTLLDLLSTQADEEDRAALRITEAALCDLVDACPRLEYLCLWNIRGVTNIFLAACAARATRLRRLYLCFAGPHLTGAGISEVGAWSNLEILHVMYMPPDHKRMMDEGFVHAVKEGCPKLQHWKLGSETGFTGWMPLRSRRPM